MNNYLSARRVLAMAAGVTIALVLGPAAHAQKPAASAATTASCRIVVPSPIVEPMPLVTDLCLGVSPRLSLPLPLPVVSKPPPR